MSDTLYNPGSDNLTASEKQHAPGGWKYTWPLELNGSRFWFRDRVARHAFAETFRALDQYGHHNAIVEDLPEELGEYR